MDGVGTFDIADKLAEADIFTCLVKTYSVDELVAYFQENMPERTNNVAMSIGAGEADYEKLRMVCETVGKKLKYVCINTKRTLG